MISVSGKEFKALSQANFIRKISKDLEYDNGQIEAWKETFNLINSLIQLNSKFESAHFIFEYPILYTDGKRPDLLLFIKDVIYIIEFKNRSAFKKDDIDQLTEYWEQIKYYHSESSKYILKPILLLNSKSYISRQSGEVKILSTLAFINGWGDYKSGSLQPINSISDFINGKYNATVDITNFAQRYLNDNPLPGINHPLLEKTKKAIDKVSDFIDESRSQELHTLILLTGEAGSGKTAMALQLYAKYKGAFITKNNKFYKLLTSKINNHPNIFTATSVIREFIERKNTLIPNVILIDEAQRTWDRRRVEEYFNKSIDEHSILLSHISGSKSWSTTIAFIGVEQELASSETSYMDEWFEAFSKYVPDKNKRRIYCSFLIEDGGEADEVFKLFHLDCNLRSNIKQIANFKHSLSQVFFSLIEDPNNSKIPDAIHKIKETGYKLYITRYLESAFSYVKDFTNSSIFPTAIIGTPEVDTDEKITFLKYQESKNVDIMSYLSLEDVELSALKKLALTQYDTLGFEFEIPIIHWNIDYTYYNGEWNYDLIKQIEGFGQYYIRNAYKVFLTRGRKGVILYFPENWKFNKTFKYFKDIGFDIIS